LPVNARAETPAAGRFRLTALPARLYVVVDQSAGISASKNTHQAAKPTSDDCTREAEVNAKSLELSLGEPAVS